MLKVFDVAAHGGLRQTLRTGRRAEAASRHDRAKTRNEIERGQAHTHKDLIGEYTFLDNSIQALPRAGCRKTKEGRQ